MVEGVLLLRLILTEGMPSAEEIRGPFPEPRYLFPELFDIGPIINLTAIEDSVLMINDAS